MPPFKFGADRFDELLDLLLAGRPSLIIDPRYVAVAAGGSDDLERLVGGGCVGWVNAERPDVVLKYEAGPDPLFLYASAAYDTTLAVLDPQGRWHCNDDFPGRGLNPGLAFFTGTTLRRPSGAATSGAATMSAGRVAGVNENIAPASLSQRRMLSAVTPLRDHRCLGANAARRCRRR
jgi:hypothetical protein